jgi:hypothetical protein
MSSATETTHLAIMKRLYPENRIETMMYDNNPLFAMLSKKYDSKGESWHRALRYTPTTGRSASFEVARANRAPSKVVKVLITTVEDYSLYAVSGKAMRSATGSGALVDIFSEEVDAAMDAMNRSYAAGIYGNGGGAIGRLTSGVTLAGTTFTLNTIDDVVKFEVGMFLTLSATDGTSGSVKAGRLQVTAVNRDTGVITVDQNISTGVLTAAASDYIFPEGDFGAKMKGLDAWIPSSAPGSTAFFGLDRSVDPVRLGGVRVSGTGYSISEAVKRGLQVGFRNGCKTSHIFMNDAKFLELDLELGSNKRYVDVTKAEVGFTGFEFVGHGGKPVEVYADPNCPVGAIYGLNLSDWSLEGPTKFPFIEAADGNKIVRDGSSDSFNGEIKSYHQMVCKAPGRQWRVDF